MIPVRWLDAHPLCWDQALLDEMLPAETPRQTVVVPARYHTPGDVDPADVAILTSDEESIFPWRELRAPLVWIQTPRPDIHAGHDRFWPLGWPADTRALLGQLQGDGPVDPTGDWWFAGQVNHRRRQEAVAAMRAVDPANVVETPGFTQGAARDRYLATLAAVKAAPCPSGPKTPDTFRVWEALEAGVVPIADGRCPAGVDGYWPFTYGQVPFPIIDDWANLPDVLAVELDRWPANANRCFAWWQLHKRTLRRQLLDDVGCSDQRPVTVLIPTSPIPTHPDTSIIETTVASVRHWLPDADIIIMCDGVRTEQEHHRGRYEAYLRRLLWLCQWRWQGVTPIVFDDFQHQANMTRVTLGHVDTPAVLFVEHDTPLVTDWLIDWPALFDAVGDQLDVIRLHHEAVIVGSHRPLMVDKTPIDFAGAPILRTTQWSQRPHLAAAGYYRRILDDHFPTSGRTMIEDKMHSVAQVEGWHAHRIGLYAPGENLKRSWHLDGRGDDPKFECRFT